jgi:hypothetical protein
MRLRALLSGAVLALIATGVTTAHSQPAKRSQRRARSSAGQRVALGRGQGGAAALPPAPARRLHPPARPHCTIKLRKAPPPCRPQSPAACLAILQQEAAEHEKGAKVFATRSPRSLCTTAKSAGAVCRPGPRSRSKRGSGRGPKRHKTVEAFIARYSGANIQRDAGRDVSASGSVRGARARRLDADSPQADTGVTLYRRLISNYPSYEDRRRSPLLGHAYTDSRIEEGQQAWRARVRR